MDEQSSENFEFSVSANDTLFVLTNNNSIYKEGVSNLISKMVILKDMNYVSLKIFSKCLGYMKITRLNIFCINNELDNNKIDCIYINNSDVRYLEMNLYNFSLFLNSEKNFWEYNKDSLYILRGGNFLDIKNIFATINGNKFNVGRGGSQKAHAVSPLDLRLSSYLIAMFNFDYKKISKFNFFDEMEKNRYLSYKDMSKKK